MSNDSPADADVPVEHTAEFKRNVRQLAKKYRRIKSDVQPVIEQLESGETPGDEVPQTGEDHIIFKVRIRNSDSGRGKSGGYRMVYWVKPSSRILITIYSKSEQGDVSPQYIRRIIAEHDEREAERE